LTSEFPHRGTARIGDVDVSHLAPILVDERG
jgi:hypothetical protein